ncbi:hypothetical protein IT401_02150 [Candidatus Nomurabacteria bacterium]|nr:hypothetical protein [Candidatus Nomurabacteria bacterium]
MDNQLIATLDRHYRQQWQREFPEVPAPRGVFEYVRRYAHMTRNYISKQQLLRREVRKQGVRGYLPLSEIEDYYLIFFDLSKLFAELIDVFADVQGYVGVKKMLALYYKRIAEVLLFWEGQFLRTMGDLGKYRVDETTPKDKLFTETSLSVIIFSQRLSRS